MYRLNHYLNNLLFYIILSAVISLLLTSIYSVAQNINTYNSKVLAVEDSTNSSYSLEIKNEEDDKFSYKIEKIDYRVIVFDYYLKINNSPLQGLGSKFVESCDRYDAPADCTVVLAIARIETDLCKYLPSQTQQNCWGFGGADTNRYYFSSYEAGIDLVNKRLVFGYGKEFMIDPNTAEMTYCGPRESCSVWGDNVLNEMNNINNLSIQLGYKALFSLR